MNFMEDPEFDELLAEDYSDSPQKFLLVLPRQPVAGRLDAVLARQLPAYSRSRLARWIGSGQVLLNGLPATPKTPVWGGERVEVNAEPDPQETAYAPEEMPLAVCYEDDSLLVLNKPAGLVVHPGAGNWAGTLLNGLLFHYPELAGVPRAGIVHRLDKDTSGLMVVARSLTAQADLVRQLQARTVKRHYLAFAQGRIDSVGTVNAPIGRHPRDRVRMAVVDSGRPAITHYQRLEAFADYSLIECRLETGRTHQIRVHMAHIGHPLAADPVYGGKPRSHPPALAQALQGLGRQALHAARLGLVHPAQGQAMGWEAPLPDDLQGLLNVLREGVLREGVLPEDVLREAGHG